MTPSYRAASAGSPTWGLEAARTLPVLPAEVPLPTAVAQDASPTGSDGFPREHLCPQSWTLINESGAKSPLATGAASHASPISHLLAGTGGTLVPTGTGHNGPCSPAWKEVLRQ